jgi:hypothetical protein
MGYYVAIQGNSNSLQKVIVKSLVVTGLSFVGLGAVLAMGFLAAVGPAGTNDPEAPSVVVVPVAATGTTGAQISSFRPSITGRAPLPPEERGLPGS